MLCFDNRALDSDTPVSEAQAMSSEIRELYHRFRQTPFPALGRKVGHFPLYDGFLAGCADRASQGELVPAAEIPDPDDETARCVDELRRKESPNQEEREFLLYFDLLEDLRVAMQRRTSD